MFYSLFPLLTSLSFLFCLPDISEQGHPFSFLIFCSFCSGRRAAAPANNNILIITIPDDLSALSALVTCYYFLCSRLCPSLKLPSCASLVSLRGTKTKTASVLTTSSRIFFFFFFFCSCRAKGQRLEEDRVEGYANSFVTLQVLLVFFPFPILEEAAMLPLSSLLDSWSIFCPRGH